MEKEIIITTDFDFPNDFFSEKILDSEKSVRIDTHKINNKKNYEDKKLEMRKKTRVKRQENRKKITEENKLKVSTMNEEEKDIYYKNKAKIETDKEDNLKLSLLSEYKIVFDLDYLNLMKAKEIKSLASQLTYCYALNKTLKIPICYYFCSYQNEIKFEMENMGSKTWSAKFYEESVIDVEEIMKSGKEIIYLSPDSNEILDEINANMIFIIGGFVDKPVSKFRSLYKANDLSFKTAKLPLEEYLVDLTNPVLNVNTVVDILANYIENNNWADAINKAIPKRMIK